MNRVSLDVRYKTVKLDSRRFIPTGHIKTSSITLIKQRLERFGSHH